MGSRLGIREWRACTHSIEGCTRFNIVCLIGCMRYVAEEGSRRNCRDC